MADDAAARPQGDDALRNLKAAVAWAVSVLNHRALYTPKDVARRLQDELDKAVATSRQSAPGPARDREPDAWTAYWLRDDGVWCSLGQRLFDSEQDADNYINHRVHSELKTRKEPVYIGTPPDTREAPALRAALVEAEAGLEAAVARSCLCTKGFRCSPHKALDAVRAALSDTASTGEANNGEP